MAQSRSLKGRVSQDGAALQPSRAVVRTAELSDLLQPAEKSWAGHLTLPGPFTSPAPRRGRQVVKALGYPRAPSRPPPPWSLNDLGIVPLLLWACFTINTMKVLVKESVRIPPSSMAFSWDLSPLLSHADSLVQDVRGMQDPGKPFSLPTCPYQIAPVVSSP